MRRRMLLKMLSKSEEGWIGGGKRDVRFLLRRSDREWSSRKREDALAEE